MRTGSTVNAAAVENTIPPNMTVANWAGAPELAPIIAIGRTPANAVSPRRKTSRNFAWVPLKHALRRLLSSLWALAIPEATKYACTTANVQTRQKPTAAPRSARMPRRKRASTPPPIASGTTVIAKATRCHMMNPQKRTRHCCLPTTDTGTTQPTFWPTRFRIGDTDCSLTFYPVSWVCLQGRPVSGHHSRIFPNCSHSNLSLASA